ncbi:glycosyltransferase [Gillisia sp. JM1]|uniref:glycosyltransferase n=1 Tax=Gillisia sp. JM1 TaxID=1283286 RepID=UPI000408839C|nr:glycosyltransferase [Gillisia sp. JM1]
MAIFLFGLFLLITLINILFFIGYFSFASAKESTSNATPPVSVIVCAKNEAENLKDFIPLILEQNYLNFEVILVNDASVDDTLEVMEYFEELDPRVHLVNVQNNEAFWGKKKYALTLGIKKAKNSTLLFTDADCRPESNMWISEMASNFQQNKTIVLGYGGYLKNKGSFLNKLIRYETLLTAIQYFSFAKWGIPYMGVGRNLAYTSQEFYAQNGFATHLHIRSGDDDLFVNQAGTKENTVITFNRASITRSIPKTDFSTWILQKRRHISTAQFYKKKHKFLLVSFFVSQIGFWILLISLLLLKIHWPIVLGILILRLLIQYIVYYKSAKKLDEMDLLWLIPFLEVFLIFTQLSIFSMNVFSKPTNWK